ncbi:MAG: hypothetical protein IKP35_00895 [Alphaproteobacteria bacterium]|nr:hypothetical protein [Alphaproteobacteria bacterium]
MKRRTGFYSFILTSVVCMLGVPGFAASSVRMLGANGNTVVGAGVDATTGATVDNGVKTNAVATGSGSVTGRASSLRFSPTVTTKTNNTASQSYSGLVSNGVQTAGGANVVSNNSPSARLSIGKYLNLSHSTKPVTPTDGGETSGSGASNADVDALRAELDALQNQVDDLKDGKQNTLVVGSGEYIDISGPGNNVISIDIQALKADLQTALGTDKDILTEIDANYKLWWCYANATKTACANTKQEIVDLGKVLDEYDLATNNESLSAALAGKQGMLTEADNGYIAIDQERGTIGVRFEDLRDALGISGTRSNEIRYTEDGKLQWRYMDEYEQDGVTKKWNTADIKSLIDSSLENYVQTQTLLDYVQRSELAGLQGTLTADADKYVEIVDNKIGVKFEDLKDALDIPTEREIEMEIDDDGKIKWRYVGADVWHKTNKGISDFVDLSDYVKSDELAGFQGALTADANGFVQINNNQIGIKYTELKDKLVQDLNIPAAAEKIEMEITEDGKLRWRYMDEYEINPETNENVKKWTVVEQSIDTLIDGKLAAYVSNDSLSTTLQNYITSTGLSTTLQDYALKTYVDTELGKKQVKLTPDENGFIEITPITGGGEKIGIKFDDLKTALGIDSVRSAEIRVDNGILQWRYMNDFEIDPETGNPKTDTNGENIKTWTNVYNLTDLLNGYVTETNLTEIVNRIDADLAGKQIKLVPAVDGHIILNEQTGEIAVDMGELLEQLSIEAGTARQSQIRVFDGKLQWRYVDEFTYEDNGNKVETWHTLNLAEVELPLYVEKTYLRNNYYNKTYVDNLARTIENNINMTLDRLALPDGPDAGLYMLSVTGSGSDKVSSWTPIQIVDGAGVVQNFSINDSGNSNSGE